MYTIKRCFTVDIAHKLELPYVSKCLNLHGHTAKITIKLSGTLNESGMVMDFNKIKQLFETPIVELLDHKLILAKRTNFAFTMANNLPNCSYTLLDIPNTTSEFLSEFICNFIVKTIQEHNIKNIKKVHVTYSETENNSASYKRVLSS